MTGRSIPHGGGIVIGCAAGVIIWTVLIIFVRPLLTHWMWP